MPSDSTGPNTRVIEVINFLAAHPTEAFTLSEIARNVGLSNGSAHRVLRAMAQARFVARHPKHKTYSLGLALVAVGRAALERHRGIAVAQREMERLAAELEAQCVATIIVEGDRLVLAKAGTPQTHDEVNRVGERHPIIPPIGLSAVAWGGENAVRDFLSRSPAKLSAVMLAHIEAALPAIRRRGYAVAATGPVMLGLRQATIPGPGLPRDEAYWAGIRDRVASLTPEEVQLIDLTRAGAGGVCYISAPVFSPAGAVEVELTLSGLPPALGSIEIERYAERLRAAAAIVTAEIHGRVP